MKYQSSARRMVSEFETEEYLSKVDVWHLVKELVKELIYLMVIISLFYVVIDMLF